MVVLLPSLPTLWTTFFLSGGKDVVDALIVGTNSKFNVGTISHGSGNVRYSSLKIGQHAVGTENFNADDKLPELEPFPITRLRRKQVDGPLNSIEKHGFMSLNSSVGWIDATTSLFCA